ncbi:MAG: trigger factor [Clostridiales bacterium]|nr:trigger factor [Clostridiales bacterium]
MKYTQNREKNTLTITFKVALEDWAAFDRRAYEQNKGKYNVPGFRKGHVPKNVLEQRYGKGLFFEDALYICAQEYYSEFLDKNKGVEPVARPAIDDKSIKSDDKGVTFAVVVTVRPEFTLGQYKGLTIAKTAPQKVKTSDVDAELSKVRERNARFIEVTDRAVQDGDQVNLDYSGKVDGVAFEGGTAEKQTLTIGSHTFIEGFEEQLVGMNIGETRDINVTFPAEYHAEELKGKPAVFTVKINGITVKELPELDDEFAKDVSEFSTLKDYKADIKKSIADRYAKDAERADENKLIETVVENTKIDIPVEMIEEQIDQYVEDFKYQLSYQGLNIDSYFKYTDKTMSDIREEYRNRAEKSVHTRLVFEEIVKAEKLKAGKKAVEAKIKAYAEQIGSTYEEFSKQLQDSDRYYFENQAVTDSLLDLLKKENTIA